LYKFVLIGIIIGFVIITKNAVGLMYSMGIMCDGFQCFEVVVGRQEEHVKTDYWGGGLHGYLSGPG